MGSDEFAHITAEGHRDNFLGEDTRLLMAVRFARGFAGMLTALFGSEDANASENDSAGFQD